MKAACIDTVLFCSSQPVQTRFSYPASSSNANLYVCPDVFHLTIEEYLHSLISLIEELARLAVNSVTLGDYRRPLEISRFVKDLHANFQILNLKNDNLRKRSDSIKYNVGLIVCIEKRRLRTDQVKKIEDVVYDLSLRNLVPQAKPV